MARPHTAKRPPQAFIDRALAKGLPTDRWITYYIRYSKCGKQFCHTCRTTKGHGPYWYATYKDDERKTKSFYIGKE